MSLPSVSHFFSESWLYRAMEPTPHAPLVRHVYARAYSASQEGGDFYTRHFVPAGYGSLAFVIAFFDTVTFLGKMVTEPVIEVINLRDGEAQALFKTRACDFYLSLKQLILLPFCIFASIFFPGEVFGRMCYPLPEGGMNPMEIEDLREQNAALLERSLGAYERVRELEVQALVLTESATRRAQEVETLQTRIRELESPRE